MRKKCLLVVLLLNVIISCRKEYKSLPDLFNKEVEIKKEEFKQLTSELGAPEYIAVKGDFLVLSDPESDTIMSVYNSKTGKLIKRFLPKGQGPNEAIYVQTTLFDSTSEYFYCNDISKNQINIFSLPDFNFVERKVLNFSSPTFSKNSQNWFYSAIGEKKPFIIESINAANSKKEFGEFVKIPEATDAIISQVMQGPIVAQENKKLAWFSAFGDAFQIYDSHLVKEKLIKSPTFNKDGSLDPKTNLGVNSLASSTEYIYATYSGVEIEKAMEKRKEAFNTKDILVFNWRGDATCHLKLPREVKSLTYDTKSDTLYCLGINENGDYAVFYIQNIDSLVKKSL